jgi:hypothetical protein
LVVVGLEQLQPQYVVLECMVVAVVGALCRYKVVGLDHGMPLDAKQPVELVGSEIVSRE